MDSKEQGSISATIQAVSTRLFKNFCCPELCMCAVTSQHGGRHSFYGSNRKKRCSKWPFNFENDQGFLALFVTFSESQNLLFLLFTSNLSYFNSFELPYKIRLLAFRSPLSYLRVPELSSFTSCLKLHITQRTIQ